MLQFSETASDRRNRIAQELMAQELAQQQFAYQGHSPVSTFDFSPSDMPSGALPEASLSTQTMDLFDPGGSLVAPNPGGSVPTPTARDAFDNTAHDWGGVFSPDPTMSTPSPDFATPANPFGGVYDDSAITTPESTPDYSNMPEFNGPLPAPGEQDASLTAPSMGAVDFAGLGGLGGLAGLGGVDTSGGAAVGGMDTSGSGSSESGSSGVG